MRYRILTPQGIEIARTALALRKTVPDLAAHEFVVGAGDMFDETVLMTVVKRIAQMQGSLSKGKGKGPVEELDRLCFDLVHSSLPRDELMLGDMGFWTRFAIRYLSSVILSRFPGKASGGSSEKKVNLDNFGLGSRKECWPYKLWVRGELSYNPDGKDKYELGRVGSVDMWTSHAHRQNFMSIKQICDELLRFQYPGVTKGKAFLFEGEENPKKGGVPGLRTLVKRLRENWASVEFALLGSNEAEKLVRHHAKGLTRADGKTVFA